jgi:hypothetical protein
MKNGKIAFGVALMSVVASQGYAGDVVQSGTIGLGRQLVGTIRPWLEYKVKDTGKRRFYTAEQICGADSRKTYDGVAVAIEAACELIGSWMEDLKAGVSGTWAEKWASSENIEKCVRDGSREQQNFAVLVLELATHIVQRLDLVDRGVVSEVWKKYLVPQQTRRKEWEKKEDGDSYDTGKWVEVEKEEEGASDKWWIPESKKGLLIITTRLEMRRCISRTVSSCSTLGTT